MWGRTGRNYSDALHLVLKWMRRADRELLLTRPKERKPKPQKHFRQSCTCVVSNNTARLGIDAHCDASSHLERGQHISHGVQGCVGTLRTSPHDYDNVEWTSSRRGAARVLLGSTTFAKGFAFTAVQEALIQGGLRCDW